MYGLGWGGGGVRDREQRFFGQQRGLVTGFRIFRIFMQNFTLEPRAQPAKTLDLGQAKAGNEFSTVKKGG